MTIRPLDSAIPTLGLSFGRLFAQVIGEGNADFSGTITITPTASRYHLPSRTLLDDDPITITVSTGDLDIIVGGIVASDAPDCTATDVAYDVAFHLRGPSGDRITIPSRRVVLPRSAGPVAHFHELTEDTTPAVPVSLPAVLRVAGLQGDVTAEALADALADALGLTTRTPAFPVPTEDRTADCTAAAGELVPVDSTSVSVRVSLPDDASRGDVVGVRRLNAAGSSVTITAADGEGISVGLQSVPSIEITSQDGVALLVSDGAGSWTPTGDWEALHVRLTVTGSDFSPVVELSAGSSATVTWAVEETGATATGLAPTFSFGSASTRHVRMSVSGGGGFADVTTLNFGFVHTDDTGLYTIGASYDHAAQQVTAIAGLALLSGLVRFAAARTPLAGTLDFTGCPNLQHVEVYSSGISGVALTGCASLVRLCVEQCALTVLDLNPVAGCLRDLRAAAQQGGTLTLTTLANPMAQLYHLCVRDQVVHGMPTASQLPVVQQRWIWGDSQSGALTSASSAIQSLLAYGNGWTSADLAGQFPTGRSGVLDLHSCSLTSVTLTGCPGLVSIDLHANNLDATAVDGVLATVDGWGTSGGTLNLAGNASPSSAGLTRIGNLLSRGWAVTTAAAGAGVLSDDFERADATGLTAVGNGWHAWNSAGANIVSGRLVRTDSADYRQILNPAGGVLPADYTVVASVPAATLSSYFGITGRWNGTNGVRCLWTSNSTTLTVGDASGAFTNNVTPTSTHAYPSSWSNSGIDHVIAMVMSGTTISIYVDGTVANPTSGTLVWQGTCATNATATGTEYGCCGDGGGSKAWNSIGTKIP